MINPQQISKLLSARYNRHGDSLETGFNCYSLAKYVRETFYNMYTPPVELYHFTAEEGSKLITSFGDNWVETQHPEPGDMALMREPGSKTWHHCGVFLGGDQVIHAYEGLGMFGRISIHDLLLLRRKFADVTFAQWQH